MVWRLYTLSNDTYIRQIIVHVNGKRKNYYRIKKKIEYLNISIEVLYQTMSYYKSHAIIQKSCNNSYQYTISINLILYY